MVDPLYWLDHRIIEEIRLAGISGGHLVQALLKTKTELTSKLDQVPG